LLTPSLPSLQHLEPTWEEFATSSQGSNVNVARVNCDEHRMLCRRFEVDGYPTLKVIADGYVHNYPGDAPRDVNAFKKFVATGFQKERGVEIPTGNGMLDPILAVAETMVLDLLDVYEKDLVPGVAILVLATAISLIFALLILPFSIGISPSFLVPRTIYVLRRPGQPSLIVSEPLKYQKMKTD